MVTRRPRERSSRPRLEAVRPLPSEEATPPVTNTCLVGALASRGSILPERDALPSEPDAPNEPPGRRQHADQGEHGGHLAGGACRCRRRWRRRRAGGADRRAARPPSAVVRGHHDPPGDGGQAGRPDRSARPARTASPPSTTSTSGARRARRPVGRAGRRRCQARPQRARPSPVRRGRRLRGRHGHGRAAGRSGRTSSRRRSTTPGAELGDQLAAEGVDQGLLARVDQGAAGRRRSPTTWLPAACDLAGRGAPTTSSSAPGSVRIDDRVVRAAAPA